MRDGQLIGTRDVAYITIDEVITMMIGREINELFPRHHCQPVRCPVGQGIEIRQEGPAR
jgi:ABC-type sugar transport system ATPase subunit